MRGLMNIRNNLGNDGDLINSIQQFWGVHSRLQREIKRDDYFVLICIKGHGGTGFGFTTTHAINICVTKEHTDFDHSAWQRAPAEEYEFRVITVRDFDERRKNLHGKWLAQGYFLKHEGAEKEVTRLAIPRLVRVSKHDLSITTRSECPVVGCAIIKRLNKLKRTFAFAILAHIRDGLVVCIVT